RRRAEPGAAPTPSLPAQNVVIEVFGTPGLRFEGSMGELGATKSVTGTVPTRLTFQTRVGFSIVLQKRTPEGELGIKVTVGDKVVNQASTKKEYGLVTYTHQPPGR
ncbi:MAG: hypothetical protein HY355_04170, partial [Armatimonadetes bacterium]|nr:hypothetical protein [Armatimonadota bacterium]